MTEQDGDSGISKTTISGLFDADGNPAALASGWLQMEEKAGRKRHRYVVLTPTTLHYFSDEADADISDAGFMQGEVSTGAAAMLVGSAGATIHLAKIYQAEPSLNGGSSFTLVMREALQDGTQAAEFYSANIEIAKGWSDAINSQKQRYKDVQPPPRTARSKTEGNLGSTAAAIAAGTARSLMLSDESTKSIKSGVFGLFGMKSGDEPVRADGDYVAHAPWEAKGIDLTSREAKSCWEDEHSHPAAVVHGWLSKKNKSGIYAGVVEKERYFVLTTQALCFFPSQEAADVRNGYMWGNAEGDRIVNNMFHKCGARLPLESVCEVRLLARASESRHAPSSPHSKRSSGSADSRSRSGSDDEDEDEDDEKPKKPAGPKPSGAKPSGAKPGGGKAGAAPSAVKPAKPEGPPPSTLIELDFGEFSLIVNAHNTKCRTAWTHALRKWSGLRKRQVDEDMFANIGGY